MSSDQKSSLLEYAVKELKQQNLRLQDELSTIEQNEIKKREELLNLQSAALEAAANGIVITDLKGNINWVNTAFTKLTGYSKEEAFNINPRILNSGIQDSSFFENLWETILAGKTWHGEIVNKRKDGTLYNEEMTITPVKDENKKITNFIAIKHNITNRKKAARNLLINQKSVEQSALGIMWINMDSEIIYSNDTILNYLGYERAEIYKIKIADLDPNWPTKEFINEQVKTRHNQPNLSFESVNIRKDGSQFPVEVVLKLIEYEQEKIIVAYIKDISKQKASRDIEQLLMSTNTLEEIYPALHKSIDNVISAPNFFIAILDKETNIVSFPYFVDEENPPPLPRLKKKGTSEYAIKTGKPLILTKETIQRLINKGEIEAIGSFPVSWIGVPLFKQENSTGLLVIQSYDKNLEYSEKDLAWLSTIIKLVTAAIERKMYENKILENENKFIAITNSTKDAITSVDDESKVVLWNRAAEELFGYLEEEVLGKASFDFIVPERFMADYKERFKTGLIIGKDFQGTFELIAKRKDGSEFEVELSVSTTNIGNNWFNTGIWRDISKKNSMKNSSDKEKEKIIETLETELTQVKSNYNILNNIIDAIPQRIHVKDKNLRFIKVNKSYCKYMGKESEEDILGKTDHDFFKSLNAKEFVEEEQKMMKTGIPITNKENAISLQNGSIGWSSKAKFPLYNNDGKSIGTFGITTDLTEKKKTEDELKDSHYKFRQLIENSTLGIFRIDENGEIIMANPAMVIMLEYYSEIEVITQKNENIYSSMNNRKRFLQILEREEKISGFEDTLFKKDGSKIEVRQSAWAVKDNKDKIIYFEVIVEDITEQNQVLKILHESEFKYRMLIDKLNEAVFLRIEDKYELVNSKFLEILELSEDDIYTDNFDLNQYLTEESKKTVQERDKLMNMGEQVEKVFELTLINANGEEKDVEVSVSYLNFNGKTASQGVVRDLTQVRKQETQIRHLQKMEAIGTLAAGIAHEINTPSQFINDNLTFLKESFTEIKPILSKNNEIVKNKNEIEKLVNLVNEADLEYLLDEIPEAIDQSLDGVKRIANIVGAMRDFAHTGPKDKISANIKNIIDSSITLSKNAWKYIAEIETDFDDTIPNIVCQPNDINQVIVNMIVNSSHAMESKFENNTSVEGKIIISTLKSEDNIEIKISDNGLGISEKVMKRIFDPFYTTKDVGKGTGQGLAIAYDIVVNKHGGNISVSSVENSGTTFTITLPIDPKVEIE